MKKSIIISKIISRQYGLKKYKKFFAKSVKFCLLKIIIS